jgi:superfamily II DNA or RNA helicase
LPAAPRTRKRFHGYRYIAEKFMRTVRGIDFDDPTEDDLRAISAWLSEQPVAIEKLVPREYQIEALAKISDTLAKSARAHLVMACGIGKTLVALWAAEELKPKTRTRKAR